MQKLTKLQAKLVGVAGVNSMAIISGIKLAYLVSLIASVLILITKDKSPHNKLKDKIKNSMRYNNEDAEEYAKYLENMCLKEYQDAYEERTITKED